MISRIRERLTVGRHSEGVDVLRRGGLERCRTGCGGAVEQTTADIDRLGRLRPFRELCQRREIAGTATPTISAAAHHDDVGNPLVLCPPQPRFALGALTAKLHAAGALAIAIESAAASHGGEVVARLELPDDCPLVGFSLSTDQAAQLRARSGRVVRVTARHEPAADMPIVHARHGTFAGPRALLIAHLCHPAPSANDNASGVAGLLAIAAA